jgi:two-component system osmolarity sensor histidine kinase EnvZ
VTLLPQSLFARTALLIGATILVFSAIAWQAIIWTAVVPSAEAAAALLTQRANQAIAARQTGAPLPEGVRFEALAPTPMEPRPASLAVRTYMERVRSRLIVNFASPEAHIHRNSAPSEIWLRTPQTPDTWLVLSWHITGPGAPLAALLVLGVAALLALGAAALSAQRLTAPLAELASAAERLSQGQRVQISNASGPSEVRSLAVAFQSMAHRLRELDQQRELMLGGISHDLRTPLARLRVAVELLGEGDRSLTEEMVMSIDEMDRMIGQFLHYTRASYRESPVLASPDEILRGTLAVYASDVRVKLELAAAASRWLAVDGLRHVVMNLVQNALEYGRPPITIRSSSSPNEIRIDVQDRGAGLSDAEWAEAVRPFHRLRNQPGGSHTGLGLAMVERLVRVCGGSLEGKRNEIGFIVTVRLPAPEPKSA